jgi:hypothetical protein
MILPARARDVYRRYSNDLHRQAERYHGSYCGCAGPYRAAGGVLGAATMKAVS